MTAKGLIQLVLDSFEAERSGDSEKGLSLISDDFKVTEMFLGKGGAFPRFEGEELRKSIQEVYKIEGREYVFKNIAADEENGVVFVEFVESYPDPKTGKVYRTPQVAVVEVKNGKLYRTRHYTDPRLSHENLSEEDIEEAFK